MIQQISYYISKAGIISAAGKIEDERRRLSDMPTPAAFVSYAPSLPALVGWYGYRVAFNGVGRVQLEAALDSLRRHFRLRDVREWYDRYSGFYIIEALFAVRMNLPGGVFGGAQPAPDLTEYLNFTMPNGGTVTLTRNGTPTVVDLEYSLDDRQTWTDWQEVGNVRTLTLTAGQIMWLRNKSETQTGFSTSIDDCYLFSFVGTVAASGNCNSLLCKIPNIVTALSDYCYFRMFYSCTSLTLFEGFTLPATTLDVSCYRDMFIFCSSLTLPDDFTLPATTLAEECYRSMFQGCTSLTLPDGFTLPATTLAISCYNDMFNGCTSLTLPDGFTLPATTLASTCYRSMFRRCTSLTLPDGFMLPATTLADNCYYYMFRNCTSLTLPNGFTLPASTLAANCYYAMFRDCSSLTLPDGFMLPATTLAISCYAYMFYNCTLLNKIHTLMTDISASNCLTDWLYGVAATGDLYCDQNLTIPTGASGIPSGWTRHDI